jgi:hypothetical protein
MIIILIQQLHESNCQPMQKADVLPESVQLACTLRASCLGGILAIPIVTRCEAIVLELESPIGVTDLMLKLMAS